MLETQSFASATALMRGQILPPSDMKSLEGSTTKRALMLLSYVGVFMAVTPAAWARSARTRYVTEANLPSFLSLVIGATRPRPRIAPHEGSPPFRQSLLSIARGTARLDAPR